MLAFVKLAASKIYELNLGFASMFALLVAKGAFDALEFSEVKEEISSSPEFARFRRYLKALDIPNPTEPVDLEKLLRDFSGPIQ